VGAPVNLGANWIDYRVESKEEPNPRDFDKQKKSLAEQLLQTKRSVAYEAFKTALDTRLKQEGKVKVMTNKMAGFGSLG
jgi:hypothetical protein